MHGVEHVLYVYLLVFYLQHISLSAKHMMYILVVSFLNTYHCALAQLHVILSNIINNRIAHYTCMHNSIISNT